MSLSIARNHGLLGLSDELAALEFPDKDGRVDVQTECHVKLFPTSSLSSARDSGFAVSYTHLTLPTILLV